MSIHAADPTTSALTARVSRLKPSGALAALARIDVDAARVAVVTLLLTALVGRFLTVGADARWLAALGQFVASSHHLAHGIPFAAAPTTAWSNPLVLAELVFHVLEAAFGDHGLVLAELVCAGVALSILAADARAGGGRSSRIAVALALATAGALPSLAIARVQMFSLVLFPLLLALLRAEARRPSRRLWLALPLLALWSNLHGGVLLGLVVLLAFLALRRLRTDPVGAIGIALLSPLALCLTPAGVGTIAYLHHLSDNLAAQRGVGQWAPLGHGPVDIVLIAASVGLGLGLAAAGRRHARPQVWELAVLAVLVFGTVTAARDGVWLVFLLVGPATASGPTAAAGSTAAGSTAPGPTASGPAATPVREPRTWNALLPIGAVIGLAVLALDVMHLPPSGGASRASIAAAVRLADGTPILADAVPAEQVALAGARIWAGNPLDAFTRTTQAAYLDWIDGPPGRAAEAILANPRIRVVLASTGSSAAAATAADPDFRQVRTDRTATVFVRRAS